jgi:hypothetical protein
MEFRVKVTQPVNAGGGYTKNEFEIDINVGTATCTDVCVENFDPMTDIIIQIVLWGILGSPCP